MTPQTRLLIATVGNKDPLQTIWQLTQPTFAFLVVSSKTAEIPSQIGLIANQHYRPIVLTDADDFPAVVDTLRRELHPAAREWIRLNPSVPVSVNFTGGTKVMTAALALICRRWSVQFDYIQGDRTGGGIDRVTGESASIRPSANPWDLLGYQTAEQAMELFDQGSPAASTALLIPALKGASPHTNTIAALQALLLFTEAYEAWDRFDHQSASHRLHQFLPQSDALHHFVDPPIGARLHKHASRDLAYLNRLISKGPRSREMVIDLLSNAKRRIREKRYDDAVARLYRACEALSQVELLNARVPIPKEGLRKNYSELARINHPLGLAFRRSRVKSLLSRRNQSILAHGYGPVSQTDAEDLLDGVLQLMGFLTADLLEFPVFFADETKSPKR